MSSELCDCTCSMFILALAQTPSQQSGAERKWRDACDAVQSHLLNVSKLTITLSSCNMVGAGKAVMGGQEAVSPRLDNSSSIDTEDNAMDDLLTCLGIEEAKSQL